MITPKSVYVVHSRCISLGGHSFLPEELINPAFRYIFNSSGCFTDFFARKRNKTPDPFIPRLGAIGMGPAAERMVSPFNNFFESLEQLEILFSDQPYSWFELFDNQEEFERWKAKKSGLGFVPGLQDQRMQFIFFELLNPLRLVGYHQEQVVAKAKLFIHIYPAGYIISHLAISLTDRALRDPNLSSDILKELRPWRKNLTWVWSSRLGNLSLKETIDDVDLLVTKAILTNRTTIYTNQNWRTSIKVDLSHTKDQYEEWSDAPFRYEWEMLSKKLANEWLNIRNNEDLKPFLFNYKASIKEILHTNQGTFFIVDKDAKRRLALRLFWSIQFLQEIVLLKEQIYKDYIDTFQTELIRLKELRLSIKKRIDEQSIFEISVFDEDIARHLWVLDKIIQQVSGLYRSLYSYLSDNTELDVRRIRAAELLNEWEEEVAQYDPFIFAIWKKVIAPLRAILGGG